MFGFRWKRKPTQVIESHHEPEFGLGAEHSVLDFDVTLSQLKELSPRAQVTFMYRLVGILPTRVLKTMSGYIANRLGNDKTTDSRPKKHNTDRDKKDRSGEVQS